MKRCRESSVINEGVANGDEYCDDEVLEPNEECCIVLKLRKCKNEVDMRIKK